MFIPLSVKWVIPFNAFELLNFDYISYSMITCIYQACDQVQTSHNYHLNTYFTKKRHMTDHSSKCIKLLINFGKLFLHR